MEIKKKKITGKDLVNYFRENNIESEIALKVIIIFYGWELEKLLNNDETLLKRDKIREVFIFTFSREILSYYNQKFNKKYIKLPKTHFSRWLERLVTERIITIVKKIKIKHEGY